MTKFVALLACLYLSAHLTGCTSGDSKDESVAPAEETAAVDSELEKVDGGAAPATDEANAGFVDEQLPEQALGEQPPPAAPADGSQVAASGEPSLDSPDAQLDPGGVTPPADSGLAAGGDNGMSLDAPPTDTAMASPPPEPVPGDNSMASSGSPDGGGSNLSVDPGAGASSSGSSSAPVAATSSGPKASLKKVKDAPFHQGGQLLNAVYVARANDNYGKISKMIYGDKSKVKDLKAANPAIASVNPGDKVYYNSPTRPTDEAAMKNFYEDTGAPADTYIAKDGDDLKKVAKNLLGNKNGWKELWVTNKDLDSKGKLVAGTEIHYWKGNQTAGSGSGLPPKGEMAAVAPGAPGGEQLPPPPEMAANNAPPPAGNDQQLPPPPDMNQAAPGTTVAEAPPPPPPAEMAPPPPPPPAEMAPPPPPPPPAAPKPPAIAAANEGGGMSNDDMMMALGGAGILAAGVAAIMVIRKRRQQKEMAAAFGDTQIGAS